MIEAIAGGEPKAEALSSLSQIPSQQASREKENVFLFTFWLSNIKIEHFCEVFTLLKGEMKD